MPSPIPDLEIEIQEIDSKLNNLNKCIIDLNRRDEIDERVNKASHLLKESFNCKVDSEEPQSLIDSCLAIIDSLEEKREILNKYLALLRTLENRISTLEDEISALKESNRNLQLDKTALQAQVESGEKARADYNKAYHLVSSVVSDKDQQLDQVTKKYNDLSAKYHTLYSQAQHLYSQTHHLSAQLKSQKVTERNFRIQALGDEATNVEKQKELESQNEELRQEVAKLKSTIATNRELIEEQQKELGILKADNDRLNHQLITTIEKIESSDAEESTDAENYDPRELSPEAEECILNTGTNIEDQATDRNSAGDKIKTRIASWLWTRSNDSSANDSATSVDNSATSVDNSATSNASVRPQS